MIMYRTLLLYIGLFHYFQGDRMFNALSLSLNNCLCCLYITYILPLSLPALLHLFFIILYIRILSFFLLNSLLLFHSEPRLLFFCTVLCLYLRLKEDSRRNLYLVVSHSLTHIIKHNLEVAWAKKNLFFFLNQQLHWGLQNKTNSIFGLLRI